MVLKVFVQGTVLSVEMHPHDFWKSASAVHWLEVLFDVLYADIVVKLCDDCLITDCLCFVL